MYDEPPDDDGYRDPEKLLEEGWIDGDDATELRALLAFVEMGDPRPGNKHDAALVLIEDILLSKPGSAEDPHVMWAKRLLERK